MEIEYEEFEDSNSCFESDGPSARRSYRTRTPLCIFIPSQSELISTSRLGDIMEAPDSILALFRSKKNDIPHYITDKTIFYPDRISSRCPNTARLETDTSKQHHHPPPFLKGVSGQDSSLALEYSHSPEQASVLQDSVFLEPAPAKRANRSHYMSSSSGNNTTIRGFANNLASMEERPTMPARQSQEEDEEDKQIAEALGLNLTEPRAFVNPTSLSNAETPSKAVRPPKSLESKHLLHTERAIGDPRKTPKAFSLPLSTPENKMQIACS